MASTLSPLRQLVKIISDNVESIETEAEKLGAAYPTIDDLFNPTTPSERLAQNPAVLKHSMLVASAASQLLATVKFPGMTLFDRIMAFQVSSCIRAVAEAGVIEIFREAAPKGVHIKELGEKTKTDPAKLGRFLRLLATHYVFKEVEPDVFTNNRLSSMLDTGKPGEVIASLSKKMYGTSEPGNPLNNPQAEQYENTSGLPSVLGHCGDECFKASAYMAEALIANDPDKFGFKRAYNFDGGFFEFADQHPGYLARMQASYEGASKIEPAVAILKGFDWKSLPVGSLVVDVGGGNGSLTELIAGHAPDLKLVIEDRPAVIDGPTKTFWNEKDERKKLIGSGRVALKAHDFFATQPADLTGKIDMFLLRYILHDWPTPACRKILRQLHDAVAKGGRLLIVDFIIPYACASSGVGANIPGAAELTTPAPAPLLANLGQANTTPYFADIQMENLLGAQERTLGEFIELTTETGWKIVRVYNVPGSGLKQIECVKA